MLLYLNRKIRVSNLHEKEGRKDQGYRTVHSKIGSKVRSIRIWNFPRITIIVVFNLGKKNKTSNTRKRFFTENLLDVFAQSIGSILRLEEIVRAQEVFLAMCTNTDNYSVGKHKDAYFADQSVENNQ